MKRITKLKLTKENRPNIPEGYAVFQDQFGVEYIQTLWYGSQGNSYTYMAVTDDFYLRQKEGGHRCCIKSCRLWSK